MQRPYEFMEVAGQSVIASVHGYALASGLELTLSCDFVVAAEDAELGFEHIRRDLLLRAGLRHRTGSKAAPLRPCVTSPGRISRL
jgi:enoyl-CoA hydratase/carnithine racemase